MLGEQRATVVDVSGLAIHGMGLVDLTLRMEDGTTMSARLGPESVPDGLQAGDLVLAMCAANMIVSLRRAEEA